MRAFTQHEVLIVVQGSSEDIGYIYFDVAEDGRGYKRITVEADIAAQRYLQWVRIIGPFGRQWYIDPDPAAVAQEPNRRHGIGSISRWLDYSVAM